MNSIVAFCSFLLFFVTSYWIFFHSSMVYWQIDCFSKIASGWKIKGSTSGIKIAINRLTLNPISCLFPLWRDSSWQEWQQDEVSARNEFRPEFDTFWPTSFQKNEHFLLRRMQCHSWTSSNDDSTCWRWVGNGTRMKLAWKKRKYIKARIKCVVSFFVFFQI